MIFLSSFLVERYRVVNYRAVFPLEGVLRMNKPYEVER